MRTKSYGKALENLDYLMSSIQRMRADSKLIQCWSKVDNSESDPSILLKLRTDEFGEVIQLPIPVRFLMTLKLRRFEFGSYDWKFFHKDTKGVVQRGRGTGEATLAVTTLAVRTGQRSLPSDNRGLDAILSKTNRLRSILEEIVEGRSSNLKTEVQEANSIKYKKIGGVVL